MKKETAGKHSSSERAMPRIVLDVLSVGSILYVGELRWFHLVVDPELWPIKLLDSLSIFVLVLPLFSVLYRVIDRANRIVSSKPDSSVYELRSWINQVR